MIAALFAERNSPEKLTQLTPTYAQTETSRFRFLALTVLSLIPSLDSYTVCGKQNLT